MPDDDQYEKAEQEFTRMMELAKSKAAADWSSGRHEFWRRNKVAVTFVPNGLRLRFGQPDRGKPLVEELLLPAEDWLLKPEIAGDVFHWFGRQKGKSYTSEELVDEIAARLAEYDDAYRNTMPEL